MLAAIQAPIILMSQNRQSEKDRVNAEHDSVDRARRPFGAALLWPA